MKSKSKPGQGYGHFQKSKWEPIKIGEDILASDKEFANLVSFEVLTDYQVTREGDGNEKSKPKKRKEVYNNFSDLDSDMEKDSNVMLELDSNTKNTNVVRDKNPSKNGKGKKKAKFEERSTLVADLNSGSEELDLNLNVNSSTVSSTSVWEVCTPEPGNDQTNAKKSPIRPTKQAKKKLKKKRIQDVLREQVVPEIEPSEYDNFNYMEWAKLGLPDVILKALKENSFDKPTPIQMLTLPASVLGKKDVVGAAETGSGKTLAFAIPIVHGILRDRKELMEEKKADDQDEEGEVEKLNGVQTLILTPTRELAVQIKRHIEVVTKYTDIKVVVIVGGLSAQKQERLLRDQPEIVIATPGRLWELVQEGNEHLATLNKIRFLAVDETDRMVEKGHFQELQGILEVLNSHPASHKNRQNFVFSATLAFTHEPPKRFKKTSLKTKKNLKPVKKVSPEQKLTEIMAMIGVRENAKVVDITSGKGTCETLTEMAISCQLSQKDYYLYYFIVRHPGRTIVFCNSINCVRRLVNLFFLLKCETFPLHSELNQKQRLRNLERFTANARAVLIATDIAARGLDITNIQHVIHYQVPKTAESYIHRSGRTARAFKGGIAIVMIEPAETSSFWNISRSLGRTEMLPMFNVDMQLFNEFKARVNMAIKVEKVEHSVRKELADVNWMEKARKDMDLASSDEDSSGDEGDGNNSKKSLQKKKKELELSKERLSQMLNANPLLLSKSTPIPLNSKK